MNQTSRHVMITLWAPPNGDAGPCRLIPRDVDFQLGRYFLSRDMLDQQLHSERLPEDNPQAPLIRWNDLDGWELIQRSTAYKIFIAKDNMQPSWPTLQSVGQQKVELGPVEPGRARKVRLMDGCNYVVLSGRGNGYATRIAVGAAALEPPLPQGYGERQLNSLRQRPTNPQSPAQPYVSPESLLMRDWLRKAQDWLNADDFYRRKVLCLKFLNRLQSNYSDPEMSWRDAIKIAGGRPETRPDQSWAESLRGILFGNRTAQFPWETIIEQLHRASLLNQDDVNRAKRLLDETSRRVTGRHNS